MQSSKAVEEIRKVIRENPELFEALEEYDRTKKLPKMSHRQRINITIDNSLLMKFKQYCREHGFNMSRLIEKHIKEELKLNGYGKRN